MRKSVNASVLALCLILTFAYPVLAGGLTVHSGKIEASVTPGMEYTYSMAVQNTSDEAMDIVVEVKGYGMTAVQDIVALDPKYDEGFYSARGWLVVFPANFTLNPGESQGITVVAKIPPDALGGRYAIVLVRTVPKREMIATISAFAGRVLLTINGSTLNHDSQISSLELKPGSPLEALVTITNQGNHHYKPRLSGVLKKGDTILAIASIDATWPIIPGYSRKFKLDFISNKTVPSGNYEINVEVRDESANLVAQYTSSFEVKQPYVPPESSAVPPEQPTTSLIQPDREPGEVLPPKQAAINWMDIVIGLVVFIVTGLLVVIIILLKRDRI